MFRIYYRFKGTPEDRYGGPWWSFDGDLKAILHRLNTWYELWEEAALLEGEGLQEESPLNIDPWSAGAERLELPQ